MNFYFNFLQCTEGVNRMHALPLVKISTLIASYIQLYSKAVLNNINHKECINLTFYLQRHAK